MDGDHLSYNNDHSVLGTLGNGELVPLMHADRRQHVYLIGKTGTGKSTLLFNLMLSDLRQGRGFALLDPHGDLAHAVADAVPVDRTNEVLYFDPADLSHPIAFNPLERVHPDRRPLVAAHIGAAFKHLWGDSWGPRLEYILGNSLRLLLDAPGSTLLGLHRLLADDKYRARLLATCSDPVIRAFWQREFAEYHDRFLIEAIAPVQNKIGALLSPPAIRNVVGQQRSTLNIPHLMNTNRVLIANLSKGRLGEAPAHLLGAFLATAFAQSAESRADIPDQDRQDFTLYADEFQLRHRQLRRDPLGNAQVETFVGAIASILGTVATAVTTGGDRQRRHSDLVPTGRGRRSVDCRRTRPCESRGADRHAEFRGVDQAHVWR